MSMNYLEYIKEYDINETVLHQLGIVNELKEIFNSSDGLEDKKSKARSLFINAMVKTTITKADDASDDSQDENQDMTSSDELIVKPATINGKKIEKITNQSTSQEVLDEILKDPFFTVSKVTLSKVHFKPRKPFITSTLQQASSSFLGINPRATMGLAQKLYEGVEINGEPTALITYMRTDSYNLSKVAVEQIRSYLSSHFPQKVSEQTRVYTSKSKNSQEAHEAIRPTNIFITPQSLIGKVEPKMLKLYELIWRNTVACQMIDQVKQKKSFTLTNSYKTSFSGAFLTILDNGWREVFTY